MKKIILCVLPILISNSSWAGFQFNSCSGNGTFSQKINKYSSIDDDIFVGTVPKGVGGFYVEMISDEDIDIRLYGNKDDKIVHWPSGILKSDVLSSETYKGTSFTYSGYYGINGNKGHEFIKLDGKAPTDLKMKVFGYKEGFATVNYSWTSKESCSGKGDNSGSGKFSQKVLKDKSLLVGKIPAGISNINVSLTSKQDIDIQLFDSSGVAVVSWKPKGLLSGPDKQTIQHQGLNIEWSGYDGVGGNKGHEYVNISGTLTDEVTIKVYGYESGSAEVKYSWGGKGNNNNNNKDVDPVAVVLPHISSTTISDSIKVKAEGIASHTIWVNNKKVGSFDSNGEANIVLHTAKIGTHKFVIFTKNSSGKSSEKVTVSVRRVGTDLIPPKLPTLTFMPVVTDKDFVPVEVHGEIGAKIKINGVSVGSINSNGTATVNIDTSDSEIVQPISITLTDESNNTSDALTFNIHKESREIASVFNKGKDTAVFMHKNLTFSEFSKSTNKIKFNKYIAASREFNFDGPYLDKITASFNWGNGYVYHLLAGGRYLRQNLTADQNYTQEKPKSTSGKWPGISAENAQKITAALVSPKNSSNVYLFLSDGKLLLLNMSSGRLVSGYPVKTENKFPGMSAYSKNIIGAIKYNSSKIYFFLKNNRHIRYSIANNSVDNGYPKNTPANWDGLTQIEAEPKSVIKSEAAWIDKSGSKYLLSSDGFLTKYSSGNKETSSHIRNRIVGIDPYWHKIRGAYDNKKGITYLFLKDGFYLKMNSETKTIIGSPINVSKGIWPGLQNKAKNISSVVFYNANSVYFFLDDSTYMRFDPENNSMYGNYPKPISDYWNGINPGTKINASMKSGSKVHMFSGLQYIAYNTSSDFVNNTSLISNSMWKSTSSTQDISFTIRPFLQLPSSSSMTVRFETNSLSSRADIYYREYGLSEYKKIPARRDNFNSRFMYATINNLKANQRYDYYVELKSEIYEGKSVTKKFHFKTYPDSNGTSSKNKFSVLALSDTQNNSTFGILKDITDGVIDYHCGSVDNCDEMLRGITISGDVVDYGSSMNQWRKDFFGQIAPIAAYVPLIPATGNHDYYGDHLSHYRKMFMLPENGFEERYYSLQVGNVKFISIDTFPISKNHGSYNNEFREKQFAWLKKNLKIASHDSGTDTVMSLFHHGCLSSMWMPGESLSSCDNVRALEDFSKETGKQSGHLFGHTHAYSRGYSRDTNHLWLNTASAAGYREPMHKEKARALTHDYDIFSVSSSHFGFTILTFNDKKVGNFSLRRYRGKVTSKSTGHANLSPIFNDKYDLLNVSSRNVSKPTIKEANKSFKNVASAVVSVMVGDKSNIEQMHWQVSTKPDFSKKTTVNVWGNLTRKVNIWYKDNGTVEGKDFNTQQGVDIFKLNIKDVNSVNFETSEQRKWDKGWMNTHESIYNPYLKGVVPVVIKFSRGKTYYWRARARDKFMNWSDWSTKAQFSIK